MMFAESLSHMAFIILRFVPSIPDLLRVFIINGCQVLSSALCASIEMIIWFFILHFVNVIITLTDLWMLNQVCIPGINPT